MNYLRSSTSQILIFNLGIIFTQNYPPFRTIFPAIYLICPTELPIKDRVVPFIVSVKFVPRLCMQVDFRMTIALRASRSLYPAIYLYFARGCKKIFSPLKTKRYYENGISWDSKEYLLHFSIVLIINQGWEIF